MKVTDTFYEKITLARKRMVWQDFGVLLLGALVLLLLIVLGRGMTLLQPLRIVLGFAYVFFVPGYCLTTALFPQVNDLDRVERLGLSIGLSVVSVSFLALLLDRLHWGLFLWPIFLGEFGVMVLFMIVTLWRRLQLPPEVIYVPKVSGWKFPASSRRYNYNLLMGAVLLILGLATWAFLVPASDRSGTEFYILGPERLVANYPYQVGPNDEVTVDVGVINREKSNLNYHFEVWVTDNLNPERRKRVLQSDFFSLGPGEKLESAVTWRMPWVGEDQKVELLLFYNDDSVPSRQLRMWINIRE